MSPPRSLPLFLTPALFCLGAFGWPGIALALPGDLDATYAGPPAGAIAIAFMEAQPDGKLLVGYRGTDQIVRYATDGAVDASFQSAPGANGALGSAGLQSSGKLLVLGTFSEYNELAANQIVRLNPDGSVDDSFHVNPQDGPIVSGEIAISADDRIVLASAPGELVRLLRLLPDGLNDPTFDPFGLDAFGLILSTRIAQDGSHFTIAERQVRKLSPMGILDPLFDIDGPTFPTALALQADGKLLVAGTHRLIADGLTAYEPDLLRFFPDGSPDLSFGLDAAFESQQFDRIHQLSIGPSGRILASGDFERFGGENVPSLLRFLPDGRRDPFFDASDVIGDKVVTGHALMPDGKVCVALDSAAGAEIVRLQGGDPPPSPPLIITQPANTAGLLHRSITLEVVAHGFPEPSYEWREDGLVIRGETGRRLTLGPLKFADTGSYTVLVSNSEGAVLSNAAEVTVSLPDPGQLDYSFVPGLTTGSFEHVEVVDGGKVLLGGHNIIRDGRSTRLARLHPDGPVDDSFETNPDPGFGVESLLIQPDGRILVGGIFDYVTRLNSDGSPDPGFTPPQPCCEEPDARHLALQADGKILVWGRTHVIEQPVERSGLVRLGADGPLDPTFPQTGYGGALLVATDGKIYTQGSNAFSTGLVRLLPDGSDDPTFAADVPTNLLLLDILEQADGKILLISLGTFQRLNPDGTRDTSFAPDLGGIYAAALEPSGKIIVGGPFLSIEGVRRTNIARLYPDGALDLSFDPGSGPGLSSKIEVIEIQPDGQILIAGDFSEFEGQPRHRVARLQGGDAAPEAPAIEAAPLGGRVPPGRPFQFLVETSAHPRPSYQWRLNGHDIIGATSHLLDLDSVGLADAGEYTVVITNALGSIESQPVTLDVPYLGFEAGELDPSFHAGQVRHIGSDAQVLDIFYRGHDDILIAGRFDTIDGTERKNLAKLSGLGRTDTDFPELPFGRLTTILPQAAGNFVIGGSLRFELHLADGSLHPDWEEDFGGIAGEVRAMVQQPDGKFIVAGDFDEYHLDPAPGLIRVNPDRTLDASFALEGGLGDEIDALALQADGKVLVGGEYGLVRLLGDGKVDPDYTVNLGTGGVEAIAMLPDGRAVIGGNFVAVDDVEHRLIAILDASGDPDPGFQSIRPLTGQIKALALQPDGDILAGGENFRLNGANIGRLLRFSREGELDPGLRVILEGGDEEIRTIEQQPDGRALIGGEFNRVNGTRRERVARVFVDQVSPITYSGGEARYVLPTVPGRHYALQASPDLASWKEVDSASSGGEILTLRHTIPAAAGRIYYRVVITRFDLR